MPDPSSPRFEAFALEPTDSGEAGRQAVEHAVAEVLGPEWSVAPFGEGADTYQVERPGADLDDGTAWEESYRLEERPRIAWAEPLFTVEVIELRSEDDDLTAQIPFGTGDAAGPPPSDPEWSVRLVEAPAAWALDPPTGGARFGAGIVVGHPDTGFTTHPEIFGPAGPGNRILVDRGFDFVREDPDATDDLEEAGKLPNPGHGTSTSSVILSGRGAPDGVSSPFVTGIAPEAKLVPLRTSLSVVLLSMRNLTRAIHRARETGCHVVSISMGGVRAKALKSAIREAHRAGLIVLAAAGNRVRFVVYPARHREVIAVAACNVDRRAWSGSCRGSRVDVTAPGEGVYRARARKTGSGVSFDVTPSSGTSYAVATTAGVAALWLAFHGRERLIQTYGKSKLAAVFQSLLKERGVDRAPGLPGGFGTGIVNARKLLEAPLPAPDLTPIGFGASPSPTAESAGFEMFQGVFEEVPPGQLRAVLADLLDTDPAGLDAVLDEVGDELAYRVMVDRDLRRRIEAAATQPVGFAAGASAAPARERLLEQGPSTRLGARLVP
jgi:serine protease